ncbi:hypothetical protein ACVXHB_03880 [Escherichia coli]
MLVPLGGVRVSRMATTCMPMVAENRFPAPSGTGSAAPATLR